MAVLAFVIATLGAGSDDPAAVAKPAEPVLLAHFILMLVSWGFLLPLGVVFARRGRNGYEAKEGAWFRIHKVFQYAGLLLQLGGFVAAVMYVQVYGLFGHFAGPHEVAGLVVVFLGLMQPVSAFFRPHPPAAGEAKTRGRLIFEIYHKGIGWLCVALSIFTIFLGIQYLILLNYDAATFTLAVALAAALLGFWLLVLLISFTPIWPATFRAVATLVGAGPPKKA